MTGNLLKESVARGPQCQSVKCSPVSQAFPNTSFHVIHKTSSQCYCPPALDEKTVEEGLCAVFKVTLEGTALASVLACSLGAAGSQGR